MTLQFHLVRTLSLQMFKFSIFKFFIVLLVTLNDVTSLKFDNSCAHSQNKIQEDTKSLICTVVPTNGVPTTVKNLRVKGEVKKLMKNMFANLPYIKYLDLSNCNISEISSLTFSFMVELNTLRLSQNNLDFITDDVFGNLMLLHELYLDGNGIKVIMDGTFKSLKSLRLLNLNGNKLLEIPGDLPPTLQKLTLNNNDIERLSMERLNNLIELEELNVCGNEINMWPAGDFLPNLRTLCLGDKIEKSATKNSNLSKLEKLQLSGRKIDSAKISSTLRERIRSLRNLKSFQIENYEVNSFEFLTNMKCLESLKLVNVSYYLTGIKLFPRNITTLSISWSPSLVLQLLNSTFSMPKLKVLSLENNNISTIEEIQSKYILNAVTYLDISDNPLNCTYEKWNWLQEKIKKYKTFLNDSNNVICNDPIIARNKNLLDVIQFQNSRDTEKPYEIKTDYMASNFTVIGRQRTFKPEVVYVFLLFLIIFILFFSIIAMCQQFLPLKYKISCTHVNEHTANSNTSEYMPKENSSSRCVAFKMKTTKDAQNHSSNEFLADASSIQQIDCKS